MTKHYVLTLDPSARYDWDRCTLRDPITAERPDIAALVAEAVGSQPGAYLVAVKLEVQVLEKTVDCQTQPLPALQELTTPIAATLQLEELAA